MAVESVKKIVVEIDTNTGERTEREATDEEMANWPSPFATYPPIEEITPE